MEASYDTPTGVPSVPTQGNWTEREFLALPNPHRFELSEGRLEVLPRTNWVHALIGLYVLDQLRAYLGIHKVGLAVPAPLYVRLWPKEIRQPDVVFCFHEHIEDRHKVQNGADLVVEVVSQGEENRKRDLEEKPALYQMAGISEYWIVDPAKCLITVLSLHQGQYIVAGEYAESSQAVSVLLPGFTVHVQSAFAAAEE